MSDELNIRAMTRSEVQQLVEWAAAEGWNPGRHDAEIFWHTDPAAFVAAEQDGELIGGGAITCYGATFGFMGFFIVRPPFRGRGLGNALWHARKERLLARLQPGASIGMDGVFNMQNYYAKGGFIFSHRDIRYCHQGAAPEPAASTSETLAPLGDIAFDQLLDYDNQCFPAPRQQFLRAWIEQDDALALGCLRNGRLSGYGVVRHCREGCKIGPLFADDEAAARALYNGLAAFAQPGPLYLDVPENNPAAVTLAQRYGMQEVFGCARMYLGPFPDIAQQRVFGVTTFELG
jgi:predicted N-acetyltransferase YhbS